MHCQMAYSLDSNTIKQTQISEIFKNMFWAVLLTAYITGDCDRPLFSLNIIYQWHNCIYTNETELHQNWTNTMIMLFTCT